MFSVKELTHGNPAKLIFFFTIPLLIGNIFQQFYNMADMIIVGQTLGKDALAAVGSTGSITFFNYRLRARTNRWPIDYYLAIFRRSKLSRSEKKLCYQHFD
jgi:O-antigen/teichoic acid export membrane protein